MSTINLEQSKHIQKFPGTDWHGLPDEKELWASHNYLDDLKNK